MFTDCTSLQVHYTFIARAVATNWFLLAGPKDLDPGIVAKFNDVCQEALLEPIVRERLDSIGLGPLGNLTPDEIKAFVGAEVQRWAPVVERANIPTA